MKEVDPKALGKVLLCQGGNSAEREVSLMSGEGVYQALLSQGVDVTIFDPKDGKLSFIEEGHFDRAFIALHGRGGEDGTIQGVFNYLGLPYTGPGVQASAIAMDKEATKTIWRSAAIPVPEGYRVSPEQVSVTLLEEIVSTFSADGVVVKPALDGSSIGVTKLKTVDVASLKKAIDLAAQQGESVLIERYIHGREFTIALLDGEALPVIEIIAPEGDYDFQNKYFGDAVKYECPARLDENRTKALQKLCEKAFNVLGARGWSRIDALEKPDGSFVLLEMNTSPGMTPHSLVPMAARAVGIDYAHLCLTLLDKAQIDQ